MLGLKAHLESGGRHSRHKAWAQGQHPLRVAERNLLVNVPQFTLSRNCTALPSKHALSASSNLGLLTLVIAGCHLQDVSLGKGTSPGVSSLREH